MIYSCENALRELVQAFAVTYTTVIWCASYHQGWRFWLKLFSAHIFTAKESFDCLLCVNVCSTSPSFLCVCVSALFFFSSCVSLLFPGVNVLCVILCIWEWLKTPMPVAAFCINPQVYALLKIRSTSPHRFKISLSFSLECISPPFLHLSH